MTNSSALLFDHTLEDFFGDQLVILTGSDHHGWESSINHLGDLFAARILLITHTAEDLSVESELFEVVAIDASSSSWAEQCRQWEALLREPPMWLMNRLDEFDPDRSALVVIPSWLEVRHCLARSTVGGRTREWGRIESKMAADEILRNAKVPTLNHEVVDLRELKSTAPVLDRPNGTVWSADRLDGFSSSGEMVRWVRSSEDFAAATKHFESHAPNVRIAPFYDGIPCSIHGMVTHDGVAAFRPVELAVIRQPDGRFTFVGINTAWQPDQVVTDTMREYTYSTGRALNEQFGFLGCFSIDCIWGADGIRATEINPRFTGGLEVINESIPGFPWRLFNAIVASGSTAPSTAELENAVTQAVAVNPKAKGWMRTELPLGTGTSSYVRDPSTLGWRRSQSSDVEDNASVRVEYAGNAAWILIDFHSAALDQSAMLSGGLASSLNSLLDLVTHGLETHD